MQKSMVKTVDFYGSELAVIEKDGQPYVAMKPIVKAMDLDWQAQHQMLQRDPVLSSTMCIIQTVGADGKKREMTCLPLRFLNGWLFKVDSSRYEGERQANIIRYQRECYDALYDYWHKGTAVNPRNPAAVSGQGVALPVFKDAVNWLGKKSSALQEDVRRVNARAARLEKDISEIKAKLAPQFPVKDHPFFQFCHFGQTQYAVKDDLYDSYITYAFIAEDGKPMSKGVFFKWLYASGYPIRSGYMAMNGRQIPVVYGISLKEHSEEDRIMAGSQVCGE